MSPADVSTGLPDPTGRRFDTAGDFDRLLPTSDDRFTLLTRIDPHGNTLLRSDDMTDLTDEKI